MQPLLTRHRALLALLLLSHLLLSVPVLLAQGDCDQPVVDAAGVLGDQVAQVQAAATELGGRGARVRVRTITSYAPASSLDDYERQIEQRCDSWRTDDGKRQADLIVLLVAQQERRTGIYYGTVWKSALDKSWTQIQTYTINPRFKTGDFAGGLVAGLRAVADAQAAGVVQRPADDSTARAPDADVSGLAYCAGFFAVVAGLIGGGVGWRRRRKARAQLQTARQRVTEAQQAVVTRIVALPQQLEDLQLRVKLLSTQVAAEDLAPLTAALTATRQSHEQALLAFDAVKQRDPEQTRAALSAAEYETLAQRYQELLPLAEQASSSAAQLGEQIERLDRIIQQLPQTISQSQSTLEQARAQVATIAADGFKVDAQQTLLDQARAALTEAEQAIERRRLILADDCAARASALIGDAARQALALPEISRQLAADLERLAQRSHAVPGLLAAGQQTLSTLNQAYTPTSWASVARNGGEAERLYATSQQTIAAARAAATMELQDWAAARAQVTQADEALGQIEALIAAMSALKTRLETAQADAPGLIAAAHGERSAIERELAQYSADVPEQVWSDLRRAASELSAADATLQQPQPNYLDAVERAERARETAQDALAAARVAHQSAEEQRQQVATALEQAAASIATAERYLASAGADGSTGAVHELRAARQELDQAQRSADLPARLEHARNAQSRADAAYSQAQRDIAAAEEQRRAAAAAVAVAAASATRHDDRSSSWDSGSSSSSSDSGGSSSSWDSSGGGASSWDSSGGSSSSWDSGGSSSSDGGGGSTGW